jgi:hypothetical protein
MLPIAAARGASANLWDTVGANASQPKLGTPPKVKPIGEWHFDKDGVPVAGPEPQPAVQSTRHDPPSGKEADRTTGDTRPTQRK